MTLKGLAPSSAHNAHCSKARLSSLTILTNIDRRGATSTSAKKNSQPQPPSNTRAFTYATKLLRQDDNKTDNTQRPAAVRTCNHQCTERLWSVRAQRTKKKIRIERARLAHDTAHLLKKNESAPFRKL